MIQKKLSGKFRKTVKLGKRKSLVIVAGGNLEESRPPLALVQNCRFVKDVTHRKWRFGKTFREKFRKAVKFGTRKSLVIVVGENLAEFRPQSALVRNCRFAKDVTRRKL